MNDEELYLEFMNGNQDACDNLFNKYRSELTRFAYLFVRDIQFAEDIVQETFLYIVQNPKIYNKKYPVKSLLYMICKSKACNFTRDMKKRKSIECDSLENYLDFSDFKNTEHVILEKEDEIKLAKAMELLNDQYRSAIYLIDFRGLSYKDASVIMGKTETQFKILIHRARQRLQKIILDDLEEETERTEFENKIIERYSNKATNQISRKTYKTSLIFISVLVLCTTTILCANTKIIENIINKVQITLGNYSNELVAQENLEEALSIKAKEYAKIILGYDIEFDKVNKLIDTRMNNKELWLFSQNDNIIVEVLKDKQLSKFVNSTENKESNKYKNIGELRTFVEKIFVKLSLNQTNYDVNVKCDEKEITFDYSIINEQNIYEKYTIIYNTEYNKISKLWVKKYESSNYNVNITKEKAIQIANSIIGEEYKLKNASLEFMKIRVDNEIEKEEFYNKSFDEVLKTTKTFYETDVRNIWILICEDSQERNKIIYIDSTTGEILKIEE